MVTPKCPSVRPSLPDPEACKERYGKFFSQTLILSNAQAGMGHMPKEESGDCGTGEGPLLGPWWATGAKERLKDEAPKLRSPGNPTLGRQETVHQTAVPRSQEGPVSLG